MLHSSERREGLRLDKKIRCILVLKHVLLRQGLRRLLEDEPELEVSAEAGTPAEALQRMFEHRPHVVITGTEFFEAGQDRARELISQASPESHVLFLTLDSQQAEKDADGTHFALPQTSVEELVQMVREVHHGRPVSMNRAPHELRDEAQTRTGSRARGLTVREREVLRMLAEGRTVRSVADSLGLSIKTVDAHKFNLMRKLGVHNKAELVVCAIQERVLKLPANF